MYQDNVMAPNFSLPLGNIATVEGAIVVPQERRPRSGHCQITGVLGSDGSLVSEAVTWRWGAPLTLTPAMPPDHAIDDLAGNWLFLGPLFNHFGHFLVESVARLWALERCGDSIDGALFVPHGTPPRALSKLAKKQFARLQVLGIDVPMKLISHPTRVERLYVPPQGLGVRKLLQGSAEMRGFAGRHIGRTIAAKGPERLYISRSALDLEGSILGEARLEEYLRTEGYEVFHPQQHPLEDQIATLKAATHVVAVDGSALHLLALVGEGPVNVGIICRRSGDVSLCISSQLNAFLNAKVDIIDALSREWDVLPAKEPTTRSWGEVDFPKLHQGLRAAGLIQSDQPWPRLPQRQVSGQLKSLGKARGTRLFVIGSLDGAGASNLSRLIARIERVRLSCMSLPGRIGRRIPLARLANRTIGKLGRGR